MIRMAVAALIHLVSAAIGILVASLVVDGMEVTLGGFVIVVVIYTVLQALMLPFIMKMTMRHARALTGGSALVASFLGLLGAKIFGNALHMANSIGTWLAATVIVWAVTALAGLVVPLVLVKLGVESARRRRAPE